MGISGVKTGAKAWSDAPQRTDLDRDGLQSISASDKDKFFQNEDLGETLNKVADPNWVDPSKKPRAVGNSQLDKDAFMTLLLTQMKNQDPTNPLKSHEMAAQLAQFTSLEKLSNIDSGIEKLRTDSAPNKNFEALTFIGKAVMTDSSKIHRSDIKDAHELSFRLAGDAVKADVKILDQEGNVVRTLTFNNLKSGKNSQTWNGIMDDGNAAPNGDYTIQVEARASNDSKIIAETKMEGVVTGVNFTPKGPQVMIGKQVVDMADIQTISDPRLMKEDAAQTFRPIPNAAAPAAGSKPALKPETKTNGAKVASLSQGNLNDLAMTQGMINKINEEGGEAGMGSGQ